MLVTFHCTHCDAKLRINANAMGSTLNCPECGAEIDIPEMKLGPGFVVGGFLIKHKIGQGGMGEVYLATQLSLERDVALKILPSKFTREKSFIVRFLKEVHYQAKMDHPNIVTAYDAGEDNGVYFMAMSHVSGETLEEWLDREGTMDEGEALQIARQIALALEYASKEKGILHRDIKPGNIMITPTLHAKVLDMGLSKNTLEKRSTTLADTLLGTPNYMSPEQIDHPQEIDTRADMFSLGMTLYHMLTGRVPFEDTSYLKTLKRHAREKLEDPRRLMPGIGEGVCRLLARMLARDPDHRYGEWQTFLDDLQCVRSDGPLPELPPGETTLDLNPPASKDAPPDPSAPPAPTDTPRAHPPHAAENKPRPRRHRTGVALSILLGLLLGLGGIALLHRMSPDRLTRPTPAPTPIPTPPPTPAEPPPSPTPVPAVDETTLRRRLTELILAYERDPTSHDETIRQLVELATESDATPIADLAAEQIIRIRRERDRAVNTARRRVRENTLRILYEQGVTAARAHLEAYEGPFMDETRLLRENLLRRIAIREQQEASQREADERQAEKAFSRLMRGLGPLILNRDWNRALKTIEQASEDPALFPVSTRIAELRADLTALREVPDTVLESYHRKINREVLIKLQTGAVYVEILELEDNGLRVSQTLFSEEGIPRGSVEREIPFSELSHDEIMDQLAPFEGEEYNLYRALILHHRGDREASREMLEGADSLLSRSVYEFLYRPIELPTPQLEPEEEEEEEEPPSPFSTPRFEIEPTPHRRDPRFPCLRIPTFLHKRFVEADQ